MLKSRGLKVGVIREADDLRLPAETDRLHEAGAEGVAVFTAGRYLLTEQFRLNEQDLLALFERHGYDLVLLEGFGDSGWAKIEVHWTILLLWQTGSRTRCRPCNGGSA